ncbi:hypothetical protein ACFQ21_18250 [Ohtaekwangia kribbensis]|uniref:Uncharacterized protein n=1 Tax=Ohtaekwangia kribbensis TaxID=688913 RepID=A0ABW3K8B9_9BACT
MKYLWMLNGGSFSGSDAFWSWQLDGSCTDLQHHEEKGKSTCLSNKKLFLVKPTYPTGSGVKMGQRLSLHKNVEVSRKHYTG